MEVGFGIGFAGLKIIKSFCFVCFCYVKALRDGGVDAQP